MDENMHQEKQSVQKREHLQEGTVRPNLIRPAVETKIVEPGEQKGVVPPPIVRLPVPDKPIHPQPQKQEKPQKVSRNISL